MTYERPERMYFAVCADGMLAPLGDHGDYEAAKATAEDLELDVAWLVCGDKAKQWAKTIETVLEVCL